MSESSDGDSDSQARQLAELRALLAVPSHPQIEKLEERLIEQRYSPAELGRGLPEAITLQAKEPDKALLQALMPMVEEALHTSVQKDRQRVVDLFYPVIGPAIRKSIAEALAAFVQSLNQVLENSLSVRGLLWRLEAMRTGVSFGEVVLRNNLLFRVEQIFLIHKDSGLPMQHVVAPEVVAQDSSLVSGMLTALQDFVRDSFTSPQGEGLGMLKVGELNVWIEQGPKAILAAVIRGSAPESLRAMLRTTLENLHVRFAAELAHFDGDDSALAGARPTLEACMTTQYRPKPSRPSPALVLICLGIVLGGGSVGYVQWQKAARWDAYVSRLRAQHGLVINAQGRENGRYYVSGLRDPLAADPLKLLLDSGIQPAQVNMTWEEYQAMFPEFLESRARAVLLPPPEVKLTLHGRILLATGRSSHHWLAAARRLAPVIPGISGYNDSAVEDLDVTTIAQERAAIEQLRILFPPLVGTISPAMEEVVAQLARRIQRLLPAVLALDGMVQIRVVGHANYSGTDTAAQTLSQLRADQVAEALRAHNIPFLILVPLGVATLASASQADDPNSRRVSFQVELFSPNQLSGAGAMIQKKVCMLGAFAVGKTSLVARFVSSIYSDHYQTTVGVKVDSKEVAVGGVPVNLVLWDMQGEDELQKVKLVYLRGAAGYLLVADGTRASTLATAESLQRKLTAAIGPVPFVLVLNNADRETDWELDAARVDALRHKGWSIRKSSARTGSGVKESFEHLAALIIRGNNG